MNQQKFKEAIFDEKQNIKDSMARVYSSKKLTEKLFAVLERTDFNQFEKLSKNEQYEIIQQIFGAPELTFANVARDEIKGLQGLVEKRKKNRAKK
jgi:hypothetical protein